MIRCLPVAIIMSVVFALPVPSAWADGKAATQDVPYEYYVFEGKDYPVCQELSDYFNRIPNLPPRFAEFPYDPNLDPRFTKPDWKEVDINTHKDIIAHFYTQEEKGYQTDAQYDANLAKFTAVIDTMIEDDVKKHEARLEFARFKIDNYEEQNVYRFYRTNFTPDGPYSRWAYYVDFPYPNKNNASKNYYNRRLNIGVQTYYERDGRRVVSTNGYDAIIFKGITFLIEYPMYSFSTVYWPERLGDELAFLHQSRDGGGRTCLLSRRPATKGKHK